MNFWSGKKFFVFLHPEMSKQLCIIAMCEVASENDSLLYRIA